MARLLIVDDDPDICFLLDTYVAGLGHESVSTGDLAVAHHHLETAAFDAIVVDVAMPVRDGPAFLGDLRRSRLAPPVAFVLSALPPSQLTAIAEAVGAHPIAKPFSEESLADALAVGLAALATRRP